jgi:hypothetical protein
VRSFVLRGVSGFLKNEKIVLGSFQPQHASRRDLPPPPPAPPGNLKQTGRESRCSGNPGRSESRCARMPRVEMRDKMTHIVNVTFIVPITVTFIVTLSQDTQPLVFIYQCYLVGMHVALLFASTTRNPEGNLS